MSAQAVLDRIEQLGLLERSLIDTLRRQVAQSGGMVTAEAVVKRLVEQGQLTSFQGNKLLAEVNTSGELGLAPDEGESLQLLDDVPANPPVASPKSVRDKSAPQTKPAPKPKSAAQPKPAPPARDEAEDSGLVPLDESSGLVPLDESAGLVPIDDGSGLTPLSGGDPLMEAAALESDPLTAQGAHGRQSAAYIPKPRRSQWESTLMFVGVGALVLMVLTGVILYLTLTTAPATEMFQQAEEAYKNEQYQDAISKYDQFLANYPEDENASLARVRKGLAQLRSVVKGAREWKVPLATAQRVLPGIENEPRFGEARDELAAILPQIAEGFATQAQSAGDISKKEAFVVQAEEGMKLVRNPTYIPTSLLNSPGTQARIEGVEAIIATVRRDISREQDLAAAVEIIKQAAEKGDTDAAYEIRDKLIKTYAGLEADPLLSEAVQAISSKQRDLVKTVSTPLEAKTDEGRPAPDFQIVLAGRSGETAASAAGQLAVVRAEGAVYGFDASTGGVLWRRYLGFDPAPQVVRLTTELDADVLAVDGSTHELLRLDAETGKPHWRLVIGEPFAEPVPAEQGIVVTTATGKVYHVDPETGTAGPHAVLPQTASIASAVDAKPGVAYQLTDHTNVFVLSIGDMQCKSVFHLGHKPGTVLAPPTVVRGYMLVAENRGPSTSRVSVISTGPGGTALKRLTTTFELKGRVVATPLTSSSRVIVMTDLGAVYVFEVDPANKRTPVTQVSALTSTETQPLAIFAAVSGGQLFVGDRRLTKYEIQASRGELVRSWPKYEGDEFIAPPQVCGGVVIHARRRAGAPGTTVTASAASDGREVWRTALGAPLAGEAYADAQRRRFIALSGSGQLFEIEQASITAGVVNTPSADLGAKTSSPLAFASRFDLGDGRLAFASRPPDVRLAVYDPSAREILRLTTPKIAAGLACTPVRFQQGLLLPCTDGRIYLIDPASGQELARPAQPPLAPGSTVKWLQPSLLPGGNRFVAADDRRRLYVVEWQPSPEPHLEVVETAEVEVELVTPMVVAGEKILCGARGRSDDSLVSFSLTELKQADELKLEGRIVWGPEVVGESTYVATDRGGLVCASADCRQVWQAPLANAWPAGAPIADDLGLVIALDDGQVRRLDLKSGSPLGEFNLAQPLSGAPVPFAGRLLLTGRDGTLYVVSLPDVAAASATSGS